MNNHTSKSAMKDCTSESHNATEWSYLALDLHNTCFDYKDRNHSAMLIEALVSIPNVIQAIIDALKNEDPYEAYGEVNLSMGRDDEEVRDYNMMHLRKYLYLEDTAIYTPRNPIPADNGHERVIKFHIGTDHIRQGYFKISNENGAERLLAFDVYRPPTLDQNGQVNWEQRCFLPTNFPKLDKVDHSGIATKAFVSPLYQEGGYWQQKAQCNVFLAPSYFDGRPHLLNDLAALHFDGNLIWEIGDYLVPTLIHEFSHTTLMCECKEPRNYDVGPQTHFHNCQEWYMDNNFTILKVLVNIHELTKTFRHIDWCENPYYTLMPGVYKMYDWLALTAALLPDGHYACMSNADNLKFLVCAYYLRKHCKLDCRTGVMRKIAEGETSGPGFPELKEESVPHAWLVNRRILQQRKKVARDCYRF